MRHYVKALTDQTGKRLLLLFLGGLLIGLGTSLPLTIAWPDIMRPPVGICLFETEMNPMEQIWIKGKVIPLPCQPTFMFMQPLVWGGFLGAGCVFGLIAYELAKRGSRGLLAALGGCSLLILSYLGSWVVPRLAGSGELSLPFSSGMAEPFAVTVFGIALLFALALGLALRTPGSLWRALVAALLTASAYWLVTWFLLGRAAIFWTHDPATPPLAHSLPVIGNGMGPMMITTMLSNLIAGTIGGWGTLFLLTVGPPSPRGVRLNPTSVHADG